MRTKRIHNPRRIDGLDDHREVPSRRAHHMATAAPMDDGIRHSGPGNGHRRSGSGFELDAFRTRLREYLTKTTEAHTALAEFLEKSGVSRALLMKLLSAEWAPYYINQMERTGHFAALEKMFRQFKNFLGPEILELSSGPGRALAIAARVYGKEKVTRLHANDFAPEMLALATRYLKKKFGAGRVVTSDLDIGDPATAFERKYDTVLLVQTAELLDNLEVALKKAVDATKPGGYIIIVSEFDSPRITTTNGQPITLPEVVPTLFNHFAKPVDTAKMRFIMEQAGSLLRSTHVEFVASDRNHVLTGFVFEKTT